MKKIKNIEEYGSAIYIKNNDQCVWFWLFYRFNEENYTVMFLGLKQISKYKQRK